MTAHAPTGRPFRPKERYVSRRTVGRVVVTGRITKLIRARACGFIRAANGQEVFFHASDVHRAKYNELHDCAAVRFDLIADLVSGPRAARVRIDRSVTPTRAVSRKPAGPVSNLSNEQHVEGPRRSHVSAWNNQADRE